MIYDKDNNQQGVPLVRLTIQLVFNKVKKYVVEIKDIKRIDNNKMNGHFQIEFSQRAEWDLGLSTAPRCCAEFYDNLTTKYIKHQTADYYVNHEMAEEKVLENAMCLGICYKLVDSDWRAQVHPDP